MKRFVFLLLIFALFLSFIGCGARRQVTIYTSVDRNFSEIILAEFEKETGIKVNAVYDIEAAKTVGLVNRLIQEKNRPQADVWWNGEFMYTLSLKDHDVLAPYQSPSAADIPDRYKDSEHYWTAFGGRGRCFIVNTDLVQEADYPQSLTDLLSDKWQGNQLTMAYPLFGTTGTHFSAMFVLDGTEQATRFARDLVARNIRVVDGNSVVRDLVQDGQALFGLTDTDDAITAIENGKPVKILFPDQTGPNPKGTMIIPNTVALIKGSRNEAEAKELIDWLLTRELEKRLIEINWAQVAVRPTDAEMKYMDASNLITYDISLEEVYEASEEALAVLREIFVR